MKSCLSLLLTGSLMILPSCGGADVDQMADESDQIRDRVIEKFRNSAEIQAELGTPVTVCLCFISFEGKRASFIETVWTCKLSGPKGDGEGQWIVKRDNEKSLLTLSSISATLEGKTIELNNPVP